MTKSDINILVVDDEQIVLDSVCRHLRKEFCSVRTALSVEDALKIMDDCDIHVVLTDLMMPEIDGLEFMKLVKDRRADIPVIMITGYATVNTALQATQLGAFDYVAKPFAKSELLGVINRAVDLALAQAALGDSRQIATGGNRLETKTFKTIGDNSWVMLERDGAVLLGVEHAFVQGLGKIQTVYLPEPGDELRQGSVYLKIFSSDLTAHPIMSPLTGTVIEVNQQVLADPNKALEDPYGEGWLVRLRPTRFDEEIALLGL